MNRKEKEEFVFGNILLLANKLTQFGDSIFPDITFKQWFLLIMISNMEADDKNINQIADFIGSTRQNVKKMLIPLEGKGYVSISRSLKDSRALNISLTEKTYKYFDDNANMAAGEIKQLFSLFSNREIEDLIGSVVKLKDSIEKMMRE